jgi:hypothetical protein
LKRYCLPSANSGNSYATKYFIHPITKYFPTLTILTIKIVKASS